MNFKKLLNTAYRHCSPISDIKPVSLDILMFIFSSFAGRTIIVFDELLNPVSFERYFSSMYIRKTALQHTQDRMVHKNQNSPSKVHATNTQEDQLPGTNLQILPTQQSK